ncbi:enoyl-[acyl-carrier-protein] reductase [Pseudoscourfieldia marina]
MATTHMPHMRRRTAALSLAWWRFKRTDAAIHHARTMGTCANCVVYDASGNLEDTQEPIHEMMTDDVVHARLLAAPVNPADVNAVQGKYPSAPTPPAVGGLEGLFEITKVTNATRGWSVGDKAIAINSTHGTWRTHGTFASQGALVKVHPETDVAFGATLKVTFATAHTMLRKYFLETCERYKGSVVVTGANSHVGRATLQLCSAWGIRTFGTARDDREDWKELQQELTELGGGTDMCTVVPLGSLRDARRASSYPPAVLCVDGVGGDAAREAIAILADSGTHVVYGGMSRKPVTVGAGSLIFRDVSVRGFWMTRWYKEANFSEVQAMVDDLVHLHREGHLVAGAVVRRPLCAESVREGMASPSRGTKLLLVPQCD